MNEEVIYIVLLELEGWSVQFKIQAFFGYTRSRKPICISTKSNLVLPKTILVSLDKSGPLSILLDLD